MTVPARFCLLLALLAAGCGPQPGTWWKGNLHTHTFWSDGQEFPEVVCALYKGRGYHFLALTEHNLMAQGEKFARGRRLASLEDLRARFDEAGRFLLISAEEVTDQVAEVPVHFNALNVSRPLLPVGGQTVGEVLRRDLERIRAVPGALPILCHPTLKDAIASEDLLALGGLEFMEIYSGNPDQNNAEDERIWDEVLTHRARAGGKPLYGLAVDDAHQYGEPGPRRALPGRGWVMVRAPALTADALLEALRRGDFYASSGVTLNDVRIGPRSYALAIDAKPSIDYSTEFLGTGGRVLAVKRGPRATYRLQGHEGYVRARVRSSKPHPNPVEPGEVESAWTQPVFVTPSRSVGV